MPAQTLGLEIMDEDQLMEEVLDKFVNCHEQTYEEFWSTFTDLSKEDNDFLLLPGTGEEDVRVCSYSPSVDQFLTAEVKPKPTVKGTQKQAEKILGDEVHPFSLDEEFDYDNMAQTPKFTAEEMEPIRELLKEERKNTNTDL
ncbi:intraflagellar transport-associated protein-like isoform X2 [Sciurus carolinensis]|uniref:intraflagellar transport-associated protein-like isoform X2 n=1 Tax=Sciurus carolinensis TaxID=30640 RepID=UPI001FB3A96A|nr:intraflagellar transport-associated protein-like isoform X2 [Sciurus carolinensis]